MIHKLNSEELSISEMGRQLGCDCKTVRKYLGCAVQRVWRQTEHPGYD